MINQQILDFIRQQLQLGVTKEKISSELLTNGWNSQDITEAFSAINIPTPPNKLNTPSVPSWIQPQIMSNTLAQPQVKYAGFWIRFGACFVDGLILLIPVIVITLLVVNLMNIPKEKYSSVGYVINLLVTWIYFIYMTYKNQATFGKRAVGVKVFSNSGEKPTLGKIILRETIGKLISGLILLIGYLMVAFTEKKQGLHDKISQTVVVYDNPNKKTPKWIIVVVILIFLVPFLLGVFSTIGLSILNSAKNKQEVKVEENKNIVSTADKVNTNISNNTELPKEKTDNLTILVNSFSDNILGYEIKYPGKWVYKKEEDKKNNATTVTFTPEEKNSSLKISVSKLALPNTKLADTSMINSFIGFLQKKVVGMGGKYNGTNDYIYKFSDGTILNGKQFESEYTYDAIKFKQRDIFIGLGNNLFWVNSLSNDVEYKTQLEIADLMLNSFIIKK